MRTDALRSLIRGDVIRPQEILTPPTIADYVRDIFEGTIAFDPCAAVDSELSQRGHVQAEKWASGPAGFADGLLMDWPDRTYCNPPYKHLKSWLQKAQYESRDQKQPRIIVLAPARSHRRWWRDARDEARDKGFILELDPIAFEGYSHTFPAPLVLLGFNLDLAAEEYDAGELLGGWG